MKKLVSLFLGIIFCFSLQVFASEQGRIYINDISANPGDTVTVQVMAEAIKGCSGGSFNVVYDHTLLELISCTKGSAMEGINPYINPQYSENTIRFTWMTVNVMTDGSVCDIQFRVKEDATSSAFVKIEALKLGDINGNSIVCDTSDGYVVIGKGSLVVTDVSLFDYSGKEISTIIAGSNKVQTEIHNTLPVTAKPLIAYVLYRDDKITSVKVKNADKAIGMNETVTAEQVVNVPMAKGYRLNVIVWDGILNINPIKNISFAGE